ncbi:glycosyltransferase family 2 protein [Providencia sneebia]|uniref:Family 2 glycosyl transferase n=1 Tax=Providencia sneebia DSM 19967 TaxID=1141660 RepID=K8WMU2_9GAMM|nr:glycosyltransferase family 2 protein [Providencia sneebia]EKT61306.1 family 2 glycosyl transferase [Providencia sneebia DSM 19967]
MNNEVKNYLLSLIIPVFNRESNIATLLDSIIKVIPENVEILIINDGSTDNTVSIIRHALNKTHQENQFKVIEHETNFGVSAARNTGLSHATGTYIGFIDSDDNISSDYFESIMPVISKLEYDIVSFDFHYENKVMMPSNETNHIEDVFRVSYWHLFSRIYKRVLWENEQFELHRRYEDVILLPYVYIKAKSIKHIPKALYIYEKNTESITHDINEYDIDDLYFATDKAISFIEKTSNVKQKHLFFLYLVNTTFLIRTYLKKTYEYYFYDQRFYKLANKIMNLVKQYDFKMSTSKKIKIKYAKIDSFFSKQKSKLKIR